MRGDSISAYLYIKDTGEAYGTKTDECDGLWK